MLNNMQDNYIIHEASKELQQKAGTGKIADDALRAAEKAIQDNKIDIYVTGLELVKKIEDALHNRELNVEDNKKYAKLVMLPLLDLKSIAGMCQMNDLCILSQQLIDIFEEISIFDADLFSVVQNYIMTVEYILQNKASNNINGLVIEMRKAYNRYIEKKNIDLELF